MMLKIQACLLVLFFSVVLPFGSNAQRETGLVLDRYSITEASRFNPANIVDSRTRLDIEVVGFTLYGQNSFAYMAKEETSILRLQLPSKASYEGTGNGRYDAQVEGQVTMPSFAMVEGDFSYGINTRIRAFAVGRKVPEFAAIFAIEGFDYTPLWYQDLESNNWRTKTMAWLEVAVQGGAIVGRNRDKILNLGVSVKYLSGIVSVNTLNDRMDIRIDSTDLGVLDFSTNYAVSQSALRGTGGAALDVGIVYEKKKKIAVGYIPHEGMYKCDYLGYDWRVGVALVDLGYVNYKRETNWGVIENAQARIENFRDSWPGGISEIDPYLQDNFGQYYQDSGERFAAWTPASFTFFGDYHIKKNWFVGATSAVAIPLANRYGVEGLPFYIAAVGRYENQNLSFSIPVKFDSFAKLGVGGMLRYKYFSIGTDNFIPFLFNVDVYGLDGYFHIKLPFTKWSTCQRSNYKWKVSDCRQPGYNNGKKKKNK